MTAYCISDRVNLDFNNIEASLRRIASKANMIVYRDKASPNYKDNAKLFLESAKKFDFQKVLLHNDIDLAHHLKADGIHLQSTQIDEISYAKSKNLFVIVSTHTLQEARKAKELGADMITFGPIFNSPNKDNPQGTDELKRVITSVKIPTIALGGIISDEEILACQKAGAVGFASIRYFI